MPETVLKKLNANILPQWKACFFAAILSGLFAHLYKITNWLPNWDSLVFRYDPQNMLCMGRWFLPVACSFSSFYDLPFLNGIIAILFHALGSVCICRILNVQKKITACFIGAVIASFPTVTSVMMYNYVADGYSIAFFLSALSALYMTKEKPRYVLSAVLLALSAGIYQAYITVTITLVLLHFITEMIFNQISFQVILKKAVRILLSGIFGLVLYAITLKILLSVFSVELLEYQGINTAASLSNFNLLASLYVIKETFIKCFFGVSGGVNVYVALNAIVFVFTLVYYAMTIVKNKIYKHPVNFFAIVVMGAFLVVGAGALAFVNAGVDYHNLMRMGYAVFYLFFLVLYEKGQETNERCACVKSWAVLFISMTMIMNQVVISNVSYHKAQIAYEKSYGVLMRIVDRIEQTPGTEKCDKLLVIGKLHDSDAYSVNLTPDLTGITDGYIIRADDEIVGQSVLCSALNDYCNKDYRFVSGEEKKTLLQREEVASMKQWPQDGCVAIVDDIVIIKLGTEGELK